MAKLNLILRKLRKEANLTQEALGNILGVGKTTISMYENDNSTPNDDIKKQIAEYFNVSIDYLLGNSKYRNWEEEYDAKRVDPPLQAISETCTDYDNGITYINVYGEIPAGQPQEAVADIIDTIEIPTSWLRGGNQYIALYVRGDSMYPKIENGDIVIIKLQPTCESGDICACYTNGYDVTLKKVIKNSRNIILQPLNPSYEIKSYKPEEIQILGKVVELRRNI